MASKLNLALSHSVVSICIQQTVMLSNKKNVLKKRKHKQIDSLLSGGNSCILEMAKVWLIKGAHSLCFCTSLAEFQTQDIHFNPISNLTAY